MFVVQRCFVWLFHWKYKGEKKFRKQFASFFINEQDEAGSFDYLITKIFNYRENMSL